MTSVTPLSPLSTNAPHGRPVLVVVADGFGIAPDADSNAISSAKTPHIDALTSGMYTTLKAHGVAVGLPTDDDMGNSEVGHNALGAGRIFAQGAKLVNEAFASGAAFKTPVWHEVVDHATDNTLHLIGLHSDGNVHASTEHLYTLLKEADKAGIQRVRLHLLTDGRDVAARSALTYLTETERVLAELNQTHKRDYKIASGGGRMAITMDRYEADWAMVDLGYQCHVNGVGEAFASATEAVTTLYESSGKDDQYLPPFVIHENGAAIGTIVDGDAVVCFNFRGDRAIEISKAFTETEFPYFDRDRLKPHPEVYYAGLLEYDGDEKVPPQYLVNPPEIDRTMGEFVCASALKSFAVSETQKFGHVTFFWNGNRSGYIDQSLETYIEIPSDNIEFNQAPAMKAREITDATIKLLESTEYAYGRINLANGDMVGHTGDLDAAIEAIEVVDACVGRLVAATQACNGILIFTADHGNADIMYTEKNGVRTPKTSHTLSPVPFAIYDAEEEPSYQLTPPDGAGLANIAATVFNLMGYHAPEGYEPSLITPTPSA